MCWDTLQSLDIVCDLNDQFEFGSHHFSYAGSSSAINILDDLYDSYSYWIQLGGLSKPAKISAN